MASAESVADSSRLDSLGAGQLLERVDGLLKARHVIAEGGPDGLLRALGYRRTLADSNGIGAYNSATDQQLDVRATIANQEALAHKRPGQDKPSTLHAIVEWDPRYYGASGRHSLHDLARLALGISSVGAEVAGAEMQTAIVRADQRPVVIQDSQGEAEWTLGQYDRQLTKRSLARANMFRKRPASLLDQGVNELEESEQGFDPKNDALIIVSDFLSGEERNNQSELTGFAWGHRLGELKEEMGDRLFIVQLTSPAQTKLPSASRFTDGNAIIEMDTNEYLAASDRYQALGVKKAEKISKVLSGFRHLNLSATSQRPMDETVDFIFDVPPEDL